jgi:hypothetical protein
MVNREEFTQQLIEVMQRSPKHYVGWVTMTHGHRSVTPMGVRVLLWSMREDRIITQVELTEMLAQLEPR